MIHRDQPHNMGGKKTWPQRAQRTQMTNMHFFVVFVFFLVKNDFAYFVVKQC